MTGSCLTLILVRGPADLQAQLEVGFLRAIHAPDNGDIFCRC